MDQNINEPNKSLETLLLENLELSRAIYRQNQKTGRYILFGQVLGLIKLVLIIGPLIAAALYFTPYLKEMFGTYENLLGAGTGQSLLQGNSLLQSVLNGQLTEEGLAPSGVPKPPAGFKVK